MTINISDFIRQKFTELQKQVPINLNLTQNNESNFSDTLANELNSNDSSYSSLLKQNSGYELTNNSTTDMSKTAYNALSAAAAIKAEKYNSSGSSNMTRISNAINLSAQKYNVDPDLIRAVIKQESSFNPYSLSGAGAQGLMQLMPNTAAGLGVNNVWNIEENIDGGTKYLAEQLREFNGDVTLALAAYNAGPGSVKKYNGVPPYAETVDYTRKVEKYYSEYKNSLG